MESDMNAGQYSWGVSMNAKSSKALRKLLYPITKPENLKYPNKHRKWRIQKKWFNRYEKQTLIGRTVLIDYSIPITITDVKIEKAGNRKRTYNITAK